MEPCCDEAANEKSLLNLNNYNSVQQARKDRKGGGICIYINKQLEFKLRNNEIETCSIETINSKSRNFIFTGVYRPLKGDIKVFKNYRKDFLKKKSASSKSDLMVGDLNINSFDYDNLESVKKFSVWFFKEFSCPLYRGKQE